MRLLADVFAIFVIALLVGAALYSLPPHFPLNEHWLGWSAILTAVMSLSTLRSRKYDRPISSVRDWATLCLWGWALSVVFFSITCWVHNVSIVEAFQLPAALWPHEDSGRYRPRYSSDLPTVGAMVAGPGLTIMATATLIRNAILKFSNAPLTTTTLNSRSSLSREQDRLFAGNYYFWFPLLVLPFFGIVLGQEAWFVYAVSHGKWILASLIFCIWVLITVAGVTVLHRTELVRYQISIAAIVTLSALTLFVIWTD